jgi:hypothetical protein
MRMEDFGTTMPDAQVPLPGPWPSSPPTRPSTPLPARGYQVGVNASAVSECYTPLES